MEPYQPPNLAARLSSQHPSQNALDGAAKSTEPGGTLRFSTSVSPLATAGTSSTSNSAPPYPANSAPYQPFGTTCVNVITNCTTPTRTAVDAPNQFSHASSPVAASSIPGAAPTILVSPAAHASSSFTHSPAAPRPQPATCQSPSPHAASPAAAVPGLTYEPFRATSYSTNHPAVRRASVDGQTVPSQPTGVTTSPALPYNPMLMHTAAAPVIGSLAAGPLPTAHSSPAKSQPSAEAPAGGQPALQPRVNQPLQQQHVVTAITAQAVVQPGLLQHQPYAAAACAATLRAASLPRPRPLITSIAHTSMEAKTAAVPAIAAAGNADPPASAPPPVADPWAAGPTAQEPQAAAAHGSVASSGAMARTEPLAYAADLEGPPIEPRDVAGSRLEGLADTAPLPPVETQPLDRAKLREQALVLHDLVGGTFDVATCEDVLVQVGGDADRAAHFMLDGALEETAGSASAGPLAPSPSTAVHSLCTDADAGFAGGGPAATVGADAAVTADWAAAPDLAASGDHAPALWVTQLAADGYIGLGGATEDGGEACSGHGATGCFEAHATGALGAWAECPHPQEAEGAQAAANSGAAADCDGLEEVTHFDDDWFTMGEADGEPLEDKVTELRIYFPHMEEMELRTMLEALNGDVQQALQRLGDMFEEDAYRQIETARQDAELAKKLQEQAAMSPGRAADGRLSGLHANATAAEEDGILDQMDAQIPAGELQPPAEASTTNRHRLGVKLLVHLFGHEADGELLSEVLAEHNGDVEASRAALQGMGLTLRQQPQQQQAKQPQEQLRNRSGVDAGPDPWLLEDGDDIDSELVSSRCPVGKTASGSGRGTGSGYHAVAGNEVAPSAAPYASSWRPNQGQPPTAPFARYNTATTGGLYTGAAAVGTYMGSNSGVSSGLGPIRLLAAIGIDFQPMGYSDGTLQCIRVAFNNTKLRDIIEKVLSAEAAERAVQGGRWGRGGLTSSDKQALWDQHRELPLALGALRSMLLKGAKAAETEDVQGNRRLVSELRRAAKQLEGTVREQHQAASNRIFSSMNAALGQEWKVDLHGLMPHEALEKLEQQLFSLRMMGAAVTWTIITGKGLHSRGDGPKLPALVDEWLERKGLHGTPLPGAVRVCLTPQVYEQLAAAEAAEQLLPRGDAAGSGTETNSGPGSAAFLGLAPVAR